MTRFLVLKSPRNKAQASVCRILGTIALASTVMTVAGPASAQSLTCELGRVEGLDGWSDAARKYWLSEITARITERARVFYETGTFKPASYSMNGITASIASAKLQMIKVKKESAASDQTIIGHVPGTEVPVYDVKSPADSAAEEAITVDQASFRLPVRLEDLPSGAKETAIVSAVCTAGSGSMADERRSAQKRSNLQNKTVIR
jgi:hypothetical protein